ncbi:MAG: slr1658 superfamily regulator [Gammaproteobacteria bacterium]
MVKTFGNFVEKNAMDHEYLLIVFSPTAVPLQQRWRNTGLSADFLSEYLSTFFPGEDVASSERRDEIKGAVSYLANELLENAMKYNYASSEHPISISMHLANDNIRFYVVNSIDPKAIASFQAFIKRLLIEDTQEIWMNQLANNSEIGGSGSGLGLLTMINDYGAQLAWKFETHEDDPKVAKVVTLVQLPI